MTTICYVGGCGRLGLSLAAWSASRGYDVWCADTNARAVEQVNQGISPIGEPQVPELLKEHAGKNLWATTDTVAAVAKSELVFIIVPTPSDVDGSFSLRYVLPACADIGCGMKECDDWKLVTVVSTVMPGDTLGEIQGAIEKASGKVAGPEYNSFNFGLCYIPEFVRQGSIVHDFANPSHTLIGYCYQKSFDAAVDYYYGVRENRAPIHFMSIPSAEVAKLSLNATIVQRMAASAQITWLCQNTPGADAADVLAAVSADPRIGKLYFEKVLWPGGGCFPRDARAFARAAELVGTVAPVAQAAHDYLRTQADNLAMMIAQVAWAEGVDKIGILGVAFKEGTDIMDESPALAVHDRLDEMDFDVLSVDPQFYKTDEDGSYEAMLEGVLRYPILVLMTPHKEFHELEQRDLSDKIIIDCRHFFPPDLKCRRYIRPGRPL